MNNLKTIALAAVGISAVVVGCGGAATDVDTSVATSSNARSEFVKQANAICEPEAARLPRAVSLYQNKHLDEPSVKAVPGAARAVIQPALQAQVNKIRALGAPPDDAAEVEEFLAALMSGVEEIIAEKPPTFEEAQLKIEPAIAIARRLGLDRCKYSIITEFNEQNNRARARQEAAKNGS